MGGVPVDVFLAMACRVYCEVFEVTWRSESNSASAMIPSMKGLFDAGDFEGIMTMLESKGRDGEGIGCESEVGGLGSSRLQDAVQTPVFGFFTNWR